MKRYYDENGNLVKEESGSRVILWLIGIVVVAMFLYTGGYLDSFLPAPQPYQNVAPYQQPQPTIVFNEPLATVAPEIVYPTAIPTATVVPADIPVVAPTIDNSVIIITDDNGYPVYTGPLTQNQFMQCVQIYESGNQDRLVDYQRPICEGLLK